MPFNSITEINRLIAETRSELARSQDDIRDPEHSAKIEKLFGRLAQLSGQRLRLMGHYSTETEPPNTGKITD